MAWLCLQRRGDVVSSHKCSLDVFLNRVLLLQVYMGLLLEKMLIIETIVKHQRPNLSFACSGNQHHLAETAETKGIRHTL